MFVLSFCIFTKQCYAEVPTPAIRRPNFEIFGHDMVVLHENDIGRRKGIFGTLTIEQRAQFMEQLTDLIGACEFTLIAVVINKPAHKAKYSDPTTPIAWRCSSAWSACDISC